MSVLGSNMPMPGASHLDGTTCLATQFLFQVVGFDCVDDESMPDPKVELLSLGFVATQHLWAGMK